MGGDEGDAQARTELQAHVIGKPKRTVVRDGDELRGRAMRAWSGDLGEPDPLADAVCAHVAAHGGDDA